MSTLNHHQIIFDDNCPMCQMYTREFVRMDLLRAENRIGFSEVSVEQQAHLDLNRSRHEIPLLDTSTGETRYGLDALFFILGTRWPWLQGLFRQSWVRAMLYPLYQLITYNRRVIAGSKAPETGFDCAPDFHSGWRITYLGLSWAVAIGLFVWMLPAGTLGLSLAVSWFGLLLWGIFRANTDWDKHGNLSSAWAMGGMMMAVFAWVSPLLGGILATALILREYRRREL